MSAVTSPGRASPETIQRLRYAPFAALAGALLIIGIIIQSGGVHANVNEDTIFLIAESKRSGRDIATAILTGLSFLSIAATLRFLFLATQRRQPAIGAYVQYLVIAAGVISAVIGVTFEIVIAGKASDFVTHGTQTYPQAKALLNGFVFTVLPIVNLAAQAGLAIGFVLLSLGAMRVGLLTRFMGYLGMIAGAFFILNIGAPVVLVQGFWLLALGVLFAGRWPQGMPPAWEAGVAIPWPSSQQSRDQRIRETAAGRKGGGRGGAAGAEQHAPRARADQDMAPAQPRVSQKRKRKRRK